MKFLYIVFVSSVFVIFQLMGCSDYLDLKGNNTLAIPTSLDDLQALLNDDVRMNELTTPSMVENWADDYYLPREQYEGLMDVFQRTYIWDLTDYNHPNDWSAGYQPIYNANYCIEALEKIDRNSINSMQYDYILGSSLFYRSYYFLHLVWAFSPVYEQSSAQLDLGIVLKEDTDFNTTSVRSSVANCYERVIKDTEAAIMLLPDLPKFPNQPSKAAGHALLARAYLSMRMYNEALIHTNKALEMKSNLCDFNDETTGVDPSELFTFKKYNNEIIFYSEINYFRGNLTSGAPVDTLLYRSYNDNDLRKHFYFTEYDGYPIFRGSYGEDFNFSGLSTDELYLIKSECLARVGAVSDAMDNLNYFLRHRFDDNSYFSPYSADSRELALDIVLQERRKSLLFRGLRFQDIKRLNREGREIKVIRNIDDKLYVLDPNEQRAIVPLPNDLRGFVK